MRKAIMGTSSKDLLLKIFEKCAGPSGCDVCRPHMAEDCLFFSELYRLNDERLDQGEGIDNKAICQLLDRCTLCGLCPCPDVRTLILEAKAAMAVEKGIPPSARLIADAQSTGRFGSFLGRSINWLNRKGMAASLLKKAANIHPDRQLPVFPGQNFFQWAKNKDQHGTQQGAVKAVQKVVYFAGCSAGYYFPEVGRATVTLLERMGINVVVPEQHCCGMPLMMEGQKQKALGKISANVESLMQAVRQGYVILCSCPTCGYFYRKLLLENAYFSEAAQKRLQPQDNEMKVPLGSGTGRFISLPKTAYQKILKDDGYFSSINPMDRIDLSQAVRDLGEFLWSYQQAHHLTFKTRDPQIRLSYFAPCHQREQAIGQPYVSIFSAIPGVEMIQVGGALDCCGMGGHLGYKKAFHPLSLKTGQPLFQKMGSEQDRIIVTDCLSCRLQFSQVFDQKVLHPIELLQV